VTDLVASLLPVLGRAKEDEFNVFDVMRHGAHEKQLSNVFGWLLDAGGTHGLGDVFQKIFIDLVNRELRQAPPISPGVYSVRQEVDTSGEGADIADLVLEDHETTIVVENYYTSDGHGHSYAGYQRFGSVGGKRSVVVMLCETENRTALTGDWQDAPVVTYANLLETLIGRVQEDSNYRRTHPEQCMFLDQMHRRFAKGRKLNDENLIDFIDVLCRTGDAQRFGWKNREDAAINFADEVRNEALDQFNGSREVLGRVKRILRGYCESTLVHQVNASLGETILSNVSARYQGIYEWTVNFHTPSDPDTPVVQVKFGPSAWKANQTDTDWKETVGLIDADYAKLFITVREGMRVVQSRVSIRDVLDGLGRDDLRLRDEIVEFLQRPSEPTERRGTEPGGSGPTPEPLPDL
jgi:hypothetical protein